MRRRARCHSRLVPAIPPPITSTSAFSGNGPGYFSGGGAQNGVLMAPNRIRLQVDFESYDVLVVGGGLAGLRAAIAAVEANPRVKVGLVSKVYPMRSHTVSAEGGAAAVMRAEDSYQTHAFDTIKGSDYLADQDVVEAFVREAPLEIIQMEHWGCPWSRDPDGKISVRPFGGMTTWRTCFAADKSGFHMLHTVFQTSLKYPQITRHDEAFVTKLLIEDSRCVGVVALDIRTGRFDAITAKSVILATGGLGRVYAFTTNGNICTGDGMALAYRAGVGLKDMEMVQFHPTGLPFTGILITEAVRGEGGYLLNNEGERFLKRYVPNKMELGPRDIISRAMITEFEAGRGFDGPHGKYMHLDVRHLGEKMIDRKLPFMRELGREFVGIDIVKDPIPVRPVQHYMMGGVDADISGVTPILGLYAAGECANVGLNGGNRLGGVEAEDRRHARDVSVHAAHHVVLDRPDGDRIFDDVDADELATELTHERQLAVDHLLAEVADVEVHVLAVRTVESATGFELELGRAGDDVARPELHLVRHVALEEALPFVVEKVASLSPDCLGDQDARERQARGMELDHLHVLEADTGAVGERHPVAGADIAVRGEGVHAAESAGREDHRLRGDRVKATGADVECDHADAPAVFDQQLGHECLVVASDLRVLEGGLEDRVQHVEAGLVGSEARPPGRHATERADVLRCRQVRL